LLPVQAEPLLPNAVEAPALRQLPRQSRTSLLMARSLTSRMSCGSVLLGSTRIGEKAMDRRAFFAAMGGVLAMGTAAKAQDVLGGVLGLPGDVLGTCADILGGGLVGGSGFRLADLQGGEYAIETSRLALERSRNPSIRDFAHLEINEQTSIAASLGATPGSVPPRPDQAAIVAQLSGLTGSRFDHHYVLGQIRGHQELLALNTAYVQSGGDPRAQAVAEVSIPTIQTHLAILHRIRAGIPAV
jgi:putative membrane protein